MIEHVVDQHPEIPDEQPVPAWTDGHRIICAVCEHAPASV